MIPEHILLALLIGHFLSDFVLQTHEQATTKAISKVSLTLHVLVYSLSMMALIIFLLPLGDWRVGIFFVITAVAHWITDYFTSKLAKRFFDKKDYHNGFVVVGADQVLHYIQLYLTFKFLYHG